MDNIHTEQSKHKTDRWIVKTIRRIKARTNNKEGKVDCEEVFGMRKEEREEVKRFLEQQTVRDTQLLSDILKVYQKHREGYLKDIKVLLHNLKVKR